MAQEKNIGAEWLELAKAAAKAERELNVKAYAVICICKKVDGKEVVLHRYELRRESLQRWAWVINWRRAKCICEDPRANIYETYYHYDKTSGENYYHYDKTSGENYGFGSDLAQLVALKGRITLQENRIREYIEANKGSLFFDEATDPQLLKVRAKLERAKENVAQAEARLKAKVERLKTAGV